MASFLHVFFFAYIGQSFSPDSVPGVHPHSVARETRAMSHTKWQVFVTGSSILTQGGFLGPALSPCCCWYCSGCCCCCHCRHRTPTRGHKTTVKLVSGRDRRVKSMGSVCICVYARLHFSGNRCDQVQTFTHKHTHMGDLCVDRLCKEDWNHRQRERDEGRSPDVLRGTVKCYKNNTRKPVVYMTPERWEIIGILFLCVCVCVGVCIARVDIKSRLALAFQDDAVLSRNGNNVTR